MSDVKVSGPLFDGRAAIAIKDGTEAIRHDLAREGEKLVVAAFTASIRDNRGRFLATVTSTDKSRTYNSHSGHKTYTMPIVVADVDTTIVTTSLATYGPWLEGTGSRNQTTRFKGYHGFRKAALELERVAETRADDAIKPYVARAN